MTIEERNNMTAGIAATTDTSIDEVERITGIINAYILDGRTSGTDRKLYNKIIAETETQTEVFIAMLYWAKITE